MEVFLAACRVGSVLRGEKRRKCTQNSKIEIQNLDVVGENTAHTFALCGVFSPPTLPPDHPPAVDHQPCTPLLQTVHANKVHTHLLSSPRVIRVNSPQFLPRAHTRTHVHKPTLVQFAPVDDYTGCKVGGEGHTAAPNQGDVMSHLADHSSA